ncbi:MAG: hypothetical protein IJH47_04290 [Oscillospiraceae bacterium]|nr:hypothetical protein [Oscillospiraceae bacterium]
MRKFWIRNNKGVEWALNGEQGVIFALPEGLGARWNILTADLGHGFRAELPTDTVPSDPVAGELNFLPPSAYATYRSFVRFLTASDQLILVYQPYGSEQYLCRGRFEFLQKGELDQTRILNVPASFTPFSPWYSPVDLDLTMQEAGENDLTYPFTYPFTYPSSTVGSWTVEISPAGDQPASLVFTFTGEAENPVLTLTGADSGVVYGQCSVSGTVSGLRLSSQWLDSYIRDGAGNDLLDAVSPGTDPFFRAPVTERCLLRLEADNELSGSASVAVNYFYRSV